MVMETALIFLLFNGEDGSRCGVRCGSWCQMSMCIVQCAAIWMETILETTPSIHRIVIVRGAISPKTKVIRLEINSENHCCNNAGSTSKVGRYKV